MSDPADHVPTGYVPRSAPRNQPRRDHLSETIDKQLLIERKARAWDALRKEAAGPVALDMDAYLARS